MNRKIDIDLQPSILNTNLTKPFLYLFTPILFLYEPLIDNFGPLDPTSMHFLIIAIGMAVCSFLFLQRMNQYGRKYVLNNIVVGVFFLFTLSLFGFGLLFGHVERSCWSLIFTSSILYLSNSVGIDSNLNEDETIGKSILFHSSIALSLYVAVYVLAKSKIILVTGTLGLIIPICAFTILAGFLKGKRYLVFISILILFLSATFHYQTSYLIVPISIFVAWFGAKIRIIRYLYCTLFILYGIAVGTTNFLIYLLQISGDSGYDNTGLRTIFAEIAFAKYKQNILFGGHLAEPLNVKILNAGKFAVLPLHNDAFVFLVGMGIIGWTLFNISLIVIIMQNWSFSKGALQLALVSGLIALQLSGIFSSNYGSSSFNFMCSLVFLHRIKSGTGARDDLVINV